MLHRPFLDSFLGRSSFPSSEDSFLVFTAPVLPCLGSDNILLIVDNRKQFFLHKPFIRIFFFFPVLCFVLSWHLFQLKQRSKIPSSFIFCVFLLLFYVFLVDSSIQ